MGPKTRIEIWTNPDPHKLHLLDTIIKFVDNEVETQLWQAAKSTDLTRLHAYVELFDDAPALTRVEDVLGIAILTSRSKPAGEAPALKPKMRWYTMLHQLRDYRAFYSKVLDTIGPGFTIFHSKVLQNRGERRLGSVTIE